MNSAEDESGGGGGEAGGLSRLKNGEQEWGQHNNSDKNARADSCPSFY